MYTLWILIMEFYENWINVPILYIVNIMKVFYFYIKNFFFIKRLKFIKFLYSWPYEKSVFLWSFVFSYKVAFYKKKQKFINIFSSPLLQIGTRTHIR